MHLTAGLCGKARGTPVQFLRAEVAAKVFGENGGRAVKKMHCTY